MTDLTIQVLDVYFPGWGWTQHIKVQRIDGKDGISWDDLQKIKNVFAGEDAMAIEIYPPESELVNEVNMRHLFVVPPGITIPNLRR